MKAKFTFILFLSLFYALSVFAQNPGTAKIHLDAGKLDKAKEAIDLAIEDPKHNVKSKTWMYRGMIYAAIAGDLTKIYINLDKDALQKAMDSYKKAMELEPEKKGSYKEAQDAIKNLHPTAINVGVMRYQDKDDRGAMNAFVLAQTTNPADTIPYIYAGEMALSLKENEIYKNSMEKLLGLQLKEKPKYFANLTFFYRDMEQNVAKAREIVEKGLKEFPGDKTLNALKLEFDVKENKLDEAISGIKKQIEDNPKDAKNYLNLGIVYEKQEKFEDAFQLYNKCIELDPTNYDANFNAGALYYNRGANILKIVNNMELSEYNKKGKQEEDKAKEEFKKALPYFEKLYGLHPKDTRVLDPLQKLHQTLGNKEKAEKLLKEISDLDKGNN